jgi:uncharacterized protein
MPSLEQARAWYTSQDPVHGFDHVARVYRLAQRIGKEEKADMEIVQAAVLLHDVDSSRTNHHLGAGVFARQVLEGEGWGEQRIQAVIHCIKAHRFRDDATQPETLEAQVVFDADKLDAIGAIGVGRAIGYAVSHQQPVFAQPSQLFIQNGQLEQGEAHSAYHEYIFKLRHLKDRMYTSTGKQMAEKRHRFMQSFFERLHEESGETVKVR